MGRSTRFNRPIASGRLLALALVGLPLDRHATVDGLGAAGLKKLDAQTVQFTLTTPDSLFAQRWGAAATNIVLTSDQAIATSALARLKFVENSLGAVYSMDDKIVAGLKDAKTILVAYREALEKLIANAKMVDDLVTEMSGSAGAILRGATAMKADLVAREPQRLEKRAPGRLQHFRNRA